MERHRQLLGGFVVVALLSAIGLGAAWSLTRPLAPDPGSDAWVEAKRERYIEIASAADPSPRNRAIYACIFDTMLDDNGALGIHLLMRAAEAQHAGAEYMPAGTHMIASPLLDVSIHCTELEESRQS